MSNLQDELILFQICSDVASSLTEQNFREMFGDHTDVFWQFWTERAKNRRVQFFYDNLDYIRNGVGTRIQARKKFEDMVVEVCAKSAGKYGYKLVKSG